MSVEVTLVATNKETGLIEGERYLGGRTTYEELQSIYKDRYDNKAVNYDGEELRTLEGYGDARLCVLALQAENVLYADCNVESVLDMVDTLQDGARYYLRMG